MPATTEIANIDIATSRATPMHEERMVQANGITLRAQAFGDPNRPAVLLIGGATASMKRWPDEFCSCLADAGRFVIRYDNRDTGRSSVFPVGAPGYSIRDMADDAVGVLDAYGVARAHVVGWSMGGMITQNVAIYHPDRIRSAFLFGTSPDARAIGSAASGGAQITDTLLLGSIGRSEGGILFDPALDIDNVQADLWIATIGAGHTFALAGRQARVLAVLPIAWGSGAGDVHAQAQRQDLAGLVDPRFKLSVGLIGAPALGVEQFAQAPRRTAVGAAVTIVPPGGNTVRSSSSTSNTTAGR